MEMEDLAVKVEGIDQRSKSNQRRIETLEKDHDVLSRLATAIEVMAAKQESMGTALDKLANKLSILESEPGKKWQMLVEKTIYIVHAAVVGYFLAFFRL